MKELFFETERLKVYRSCPEFLDHLYEVLGNEEVMRYVAGKPLTYDETIERLKICTTHWERHGFSLGFVFEKESGAFVGRAGLIHLAYVDTQPEIEIAYVLLKPFWGKGYATELAKAIIKWGFSNLPIESLIGVCEIENQPSERVLRKVGMQFGKTAPYPSHGRVSYFFRCLK